VQATANVAAAAALGANQQHLPAAALPLMPGTLPAVTVA
jgi:hypothetical protein